MTAFKSTQETRRTGTPPKVLETIDAHGRIRTAYFDWTVPVGNAAIADTADLCMIPKNARIVGGKAAWQAMSTGAGAATGAIGVAGTAAKYLEATSMDAAGSSFFADTIVRNFGEVLAADTVLLLTVSVEAFLAGAKLAGYVQYVMD